MFFWEINSELETFEVDNFTLHWKFNFMILIVHMMGMTIKRERLFLVSLSLIANTESLTALSNSKVQFIFNIKIT